jgi:DNA-binding NarL/FixJ family response regulator
MRKQTIPRLGVAFLETEEMTACGLYSFISSQPELACLWSADDLRVTLKNLTVSQPQVLLIDAEIGLTKIYTLLQALRKHPGVSTVVWGRNPYSLPLSALKAKGVRGIIPKNADGTLLLECFMTTTAGEYFGFGSEILAPREPDAVVDQAVDAEVKFTSENCPTETTVPQNGHAGTIGKFVLEKNLVSALQPSGPFVDHLSFSLNPREVEIGKLIILGYTNKEIAAFMLKKSPKWQDPNDPYTGLSEGTVKVYISKIFRKLGVLNRQELILTFLALRIYPCPAAIQERLAEFRRRQEAYGNKFKKGRRTSVMLVSTRYGICADAELPLQ